MSKHTRRQTPASRNNRRATITAKRNGDDIGSYGGLDPTRKSKRKKHTLGFTKPGGNQ